MLTLMALIAAVTSVQMAINEKFDTAILMLVAAAILDILDGAAARALKAQSAFGAQLDSLSDFLAFGVAPSLLLYVWTLDEAGKLGWIATVILPVAAALRLARFNVAALSPDDRPAWKKKYFSGVPAPAGCGLALLPAYIYQISPETFDVFSFATPLIALWTVIVAALMVSRIPTIALKSMHVPSRMIIPVMAALGALIAALIHAPWIMLTILSVSYLITIPVVFHRYRQKEKQYQAQPEELASLAFGLTSFDPLADTPDKSDP
jgi:CDP-diacylglycerol--serine O-phosphatidyltransferase